MRHALAALVLALAACAPTHSQVPHTNRVETLERETIALVHETEAGEIRAHCSGVWVAEDAFLTAGHCVTHGDKVQYVVRGDLLQRAEDEVEGVHFGLVVARDEEHDLALVRARLAPAHLYANVATPTVGQNAYSMGHPLGLWWSFSAGQVSALRMQDGVWYVQSTAPISPGNSGGGLFDDDGDLLGMADFYYPRGENVNFFVSATHIAAFLKEQGL